MNRALLSAFASAAFAALTLSGSPVGTHSTAAAAPAAKSPLDFTVKDIDGKDVSLAKYKGSVVLIVNVASKCGNTPQYKDLEAMYEKYKGQGLKIVAFPANDFGHQEPGTNTEIKEFCTSTYNVSFDMFSKIVVKGEDKAPLYAFLTGEDTDPKFPGEIKWNFEKFLVDRQGKVIARFEPGMKPTEPEVIAATEAALKAKAPAPATKTKKTAAK